MVFAGYWIFKAFSTKRTMEKRNWWPGQRIFFWLFVIIVVILSYTGTLSKYTGLPLYQKNLTVMVIADALSLIGIIVMLWARKTLGSNWSGSVVFKEQHELVIDGPYAFVRHPIYSGVLMLSLGAVTFHGHSYGFIAFVFFTIGLWYKSDQEERLLTDHFPQDYPNYRKRVRRFVPFIL